MSEPQIPVHPDAKKDLLGLVSDARTALDDPGALDLAYHRVAIGGDPRHMAPIKYALDRLDDVFQACENKDGDIEALLVPLTPAELGLIREALDSHEYWQLSDPEYRDSGYVRDPGAEDEEAVEGIKACRALESKLADIAPLAPMWGQQPYYDERGSHDSETTD